MTPPAVCEDKTSGLYRTCPITSPLPNILAYQENLLCEGFITPFQAKRERKALARIEVLQMAVDMRRVGRSSPESYEGTYTDVDVVTYGESLVALVQTGLDQGFLSRNRSTLNPWKYISRLEAYALLMKGVCLAPEYGGEPNWAELLYQKAYDNGITQRPWEAFRPNQIIPKSEVFVLASRLADWADRTGGCSQRPQCQK